MNIILKVEGIACNKCEERIKNALNGFENLLEVIASHEEGTVTLVPNGELDIESIKDKIDALGFEVLE